ncbi:MAG: histidine kinase [Cyclobacteriaceae bacterium]
MFRKITSIRWLQHLVFWGLSFYIIGSYFSISSYIKLIDFIYSFFFHIPLVIMVFVNVRWILPKYFSYQKLYLFVIGNVLNIVVAMALHWLIFELTIPVLPIEFYIVSFTDIQILAFIFFLYIIISTLLKLSKSWFLLEQAEKENLTLELTALKSQVNPHFLFNTLNSIYSLSLKGSKDTPQVVLKLSELLRYMLYEISDEFVSLNDEIHIMRDYLDLQKIRLDDSSKIVFNVEGDTDHVLIPPLLFFPLIENSFKHGLKGTSRDSFVTIDLLLNKQYLIFDIRNNKGAIDVTESDAYGGIGLENVKKRLELTYGEETDFHIEEDNETFRVITKFKY